MVDHVQALPISDSGMSPARSEADAQLYATKTKSPRQRPQDIETVSKSSLSFHWNGPPDGRTMLLECFGSD